jgi:hypothetical protein
MYEVKITKGVVAREVEGQPRWYKVWAGDVLYGRLPEDVVHALGNANEEGKQAFADLLWGRVDHGERAGRSKAQRAMRVALGIDVALIRSLSSGIDDDDC